MSDIRVPPQTQVFHPLADDLEALPKAGGGIMNESQLVQAIKVHIAKGDKAADKADQHYRSAGQHLKTLKATHGGSWAEWEALLKTKVGIGKSRASELMRIADGTKTVEQVRAGSAERKAKERAKSLRDVTEKSVPLPSLRSEDNASDPELSAEAMNDVVGWLSISPVEECRRVFNVVGKKRMGQMIPPAWSMSPPGRASVRLSILYTRIAALEAEVAALEAEVRERDRAIQKLQRQLGADPDAGLGISPSLREVAA